MLRSSFLLLFGAIASAEPRLPAIFSNHMVLQRDMAVPVWGQAAAGERVEVEFGGQKKATTADAMGRWKLTLDAMPASLEPRVLKVGPVSFHDVLVGEVWLCSGQSNMTMSVGVSADAEKEVAAADHPFIRLFTVAPNPVLQPVADVKGEWSPVRPEERSVVFGCGILFRPETAGGAEGAGRLDPFFRRWHAHRIVDPS